MGANSRNKGASFEREIATRIHEHLGVEVKRDLEQYRQRDRGDLIGLSGWTIECKRRSGGGVPVVWWEQVCAAAKEQGEFPVLIYRFDRQDARCRVPLRAINPKIENTALFTDMDFPTWCEVVRVA